MNFSDISPGVAIFGGALLGLAASLMLLFNGKITGISGIFAGLIRPSPGDIGWRATFVAGLLAGGIVLAFAMPTTIADVQTRTTALVVFSGLLVGFGVRMGNGCTSGHGICGLSRLSPRSLVATITFVGTGMIVATLFGLMGDAS